MEDVLQDMYEILAAGNSWRCHMVAVEVDVRKFVPGVWSG